MSKVLPSLDMTMNSPHYSLAGNIGQRIVERKPDIFFLVYLSIWGKWMEISEQCSEGCGVGGGLLCQSQ